MYNTLQNLAFVIELNIIVKSSRGCVRSSILQYMNKSSFNNYATFRVN